MSKKLIKITLVTLLIIIAIAFISMAVNSNSEYDEAVSAFDQVLNNLTTPTDLFAILHPEEEEEENEEIEQSEEVKEHIKDPEKSIIFVDAGHGCTNEDKKTGTAVGGTFSYISPTLQEYQNNYYIAEVVKEKLEDEGYNVMMSRDSPERTDSAPGNWTRGELAAQCDGAVIIHSNGGAAGQVWYFEVAPNNWVSDGVMREAFMAEMDKHQTRTKTQDVYRKATNLQTAYIKSGGDPSKLLYAEVGEHDGPQSHVTWLASEVGHNDIAEALVAAVKAKIPVEKEGSGEDSDHEDNTDDEEAESDNESNSENPNNSDSENTNESDSDSSSGDICEAAEEVWNDWVNNGVYYTDEPHQFYDGTHIAQCVQYVMTSLERAGICEWDTTTSYSDYATVVISDLNNNPKLQKVNLGSTESTQYGCDFANFENVKDKMSAGDIVVHYYISNGSNYGLGHIDIYGGSGWNYYSWGGGEFTGTLTGGTNTNFPEQNIPCHTMNPAEQLALYKGYDYSSTWNDYKNVYGYKDMVTVWRVKD